MRNFNGVLQVFKMIVVFFALSACSFHQQQEVRQKRQSCYKSCLEKNQQCNKVCDQDPVTCNIKANAAAAVHFSQYRRQQLIQGQPVTAEPQSFRDPLACTKTTCDCIKDNRVCMQACQGTIHKRLQKVMRFH